MTTGVATTLTPPPDTDEKKEVATAGVASAVERSLCTVLAAVTESAMILAVRTTDPAATVTVTEEVATLAAAAKVAAISLSLDSG